jgi:hypothetical protein
VSTGGVATPRSDRLAGPTQGTEKKAQMKQNDGRQSI